MKKIILTIFAFVALVLYGKSEGGRCTGAVTSGHSGIRNRDKV